MFHEHREKQDLIACLVKLFLRPKIIDKKLHIFLLSKSTVNDRIKL